MGCAGRASLKVGQLLSAIAASSYLHGVTLSSGRDLLRYKNNQATLARLRPPTVAQETSPTLALIKLTLFSVRFIRNIFP